MSIRKKFYVPGQGAMLLLLLPPQCPLRYLTYVCSCSCLLHSSSSSDLPMLPPSRARA